MPHPIHKCTNTLYDYAIMHELKKKLERYLRENLLRPGPRLMKKKNLPGRGRTKVEKHCYRQLNEHNSYKAEQQRPALPCAHHHRDNSRVDTYCSVLRAQNGVCTYHKLERISRTYWATRKLAQLP